MTTFTFFCTGFLVISTLYFIIIFLIDIGIFRLKGIAVTGHRPVTKVSIIIPARNEEETIVNCLLDLERQVYPPDLIEVIVVNDNSIDQTEKRVLGFSKEHSSMNLRIITSGSIAKDQAFKKRSILSGIENSTGDLIITTDADTRSYPSWISSIAIFYEQKHPEMIIGPVSFYEAGSFFERLQVIEFTGLMAATAGSCNAGFPLMCNGANLAFTRKAWLATCNSAEGSAHPSGDDMFLMMKIRKRFGPASIKFIYSEEAVVSTKPERSFLSFFNQRLRWVSKSRGYTDPVVMAVSVLTWLFNCLLLSGLVAWIFSLRLLLLSCCMLELKMIIEFPAVYRVMTLTGGKRSLYLYPVVQILDLVYVTLIGVLGNVVPYEWKGRKISPVKQNTRE